MKHILSSVILCGVLGGTSVQCATTYNDFVKGIDLTGKSSATGAQINQLIDNATVAANRGMIIVTNSAPTNPRFTNWLWLDTSTTPPGLKTYSSGAWSSANIAPDSVVTSSITNGAVTLAKMAPDSVDTSKIVAGTINASDIAPDAIETDKIINGAVRSNKIANGTITTTNVAWRTLIGDNIANGTITSTNIAAATLTAWQLATNTLTLEYLTNSGASMITSNQIARDTVTGTNIASATIQGTNIAGSTITTNLLSASTLALLPKAYACINSDASIARSFNIAVTSYSGGLGVFTFSNALPDANYIAIVNVYTNGGTGRPFTYLTAKTANGFSIRTAEETTLVNYSQVSILIY